MALGIVEELLGWVGLLRASRGLGGGSCAATRRGVLPEAPVTSDSGPDHTSRAKSTFLQHHPRLDSIVLGCAVVVRIGGPDTRGRLRFFSVRERNAPHCADLDHGAGAAGRPCARAYLEHDDPRARQRGRLAGRRVCQPLARGAARATGVRSGRVPRRHGRMATYGGGGVPPHVRPFNGGWGGLLGLEQQRSDGRARLHCGRWPSSRGGGVLPFVRPVDGGRSELLGKQRRWAE